MICSNYDTVFPVRTIYCVEHVPKYETHFIVALLPHIYYGPCLIYVKTLYTLALPEKFNKFCKICLYHILLSYCFDQVWSPSVNIFIFKSE